MQLKSARIQTLLFSLILSLNLPAWSDEIAGRTLEEWSEDLSVPNETVQLRATKMIGLFGKEALPSLERLLKSPNDAIRYWAANHLGNLGSDANDSLPTLKAAVNDPSLPVRMSINYALSRIDEPGPWFVSLVKGVQSDERSIACSAADFLTRIGPPARSTLPILQETFDRHSQPGGDYHIRGAVKNALRAIKDEGTLEHHIRPEGGGLPRDFGEVPRATGPAARSLSKAKRQPNILWISCEDISPNLGCYGDAYASTPNLDRLAEQGARFTRAFTPAGVCAVNRTGIITGMYPISYGGQHMRTTVPFPKGVKFFPEYLRAAGYFCTNKAKTDYQTNANLSTVWDRQGTRHSDWRDRAPGQPFFSVINLTISHESQIRHGAQTHAHLLTNLHPTQRHNPDEAGPYMPPIYPETPEARKDWAWYQDNISEMDRQAGVILRRLEEDGLTDNTIVIFWSDHGRGLPRGKRWIYDSGVHIPMIVRWPGQIAPNSLNQELVSTQDLTKTMLTLAGMTPPNYMHGRVFLGREKEPEPDYLFFHRDRMDEALEFMRAARDHRFKYIRNFEPDRPYAQHIDYMDMMPTLVDLRRLHHEGKLNEVQSLWFRPSKPIEELYDIIADPHETQNLAILPQFQQTLVKMRSALETWQVEIGDLGLVPEPILHQRIQARSRKY